MSDFIQGLGEAPRRTPQQLLEYWRLKATEERVSEKSTLRHGMPDQSKWHEGKADAIEQFADELEYLIIPRIIPRAELEELLGLLGRAAFACDSDLFSERADKFRQKYLKP